MNHNDNAPAIPRPVQQKLCPLLTRSTGEPTSCQGMHCAWWKGNYSSVTMTSYGGSCALVDIARSLDNT